MMQKPRKGEYLEILLRSSQTIFSVREAALLWREGTGKQVAIRLASYARVGKLIRVRRGFYAKDNNYNPLELATKIYTPAYISLETVLTRTGVNFQKYQNIFVASYLNRQIKVGEHKIQYVHIKNYVLSNIKGIKSENGVSVATKERAFLDRVYISHDYHFDNLATLDWDRVWDILPIYNNQRMEQKVKSYYQQYKREKI